MSDSLTRAIVRLFNKERFYAELILQMNRVISKSIPTAGVYIKDKVVLVVNPDFFNSLSQDEQVAVLKHECGHILNDHIARFKAIDPTVYGKSDQVGEVINKMKHRSINVAADCALNCNIPDLPKGGMYPKNFDLPDGETFEFYHEHLKDSKKMQEIEGIDNHELWAESEGDKEVLREKVRQAINKAATNARAAGKMSSDDELLVSRLNNKSKDWRSVLKQFASRNLLISLEESRKKRNRRYGISVPGIVKTEKLHIGVAIDTSGSVSDEALNQFMAEIANIAKYAVVTVVEADAEVKNAYAFDPRKQYKIKGRGGTAYQPAFDYFNNNTEVDGVIYFGDMDCFDHEDIKKPKYPVMWAIVGSQKPPVEWGRSINIEVQDERL